MIFFYYILSKIYAFIVFGWHLFFILNPASIYKSKIPVVSIGNITVGGTGKTPMTIFLSKLLTKKNISHVIISRGYRKKTRGLLEINNTTIEGLSPQQCGDEPYMMAKKLKNISVVVDHNKVRALKYVSQKIKPQIIILDDGFQSLRIKRDLDIVLVNSIYNQKDFNLLPLGKLREPVKNINRADLMVFTKTNLLKKGSGTLPIKEYMASQSCYRGPDIASETHSQALIYNIETKKLEQLKIDKQLYIVLGVCGIGDPYSFLKTSKLFFQFKESVCFPDHYNYTIKDLKLFFNLCYRYNLKYITTTYKDFIKIRPLYNKLGLFQIKLLVVDINIKISNQSVLENKIDSLLFVGKR
ncbi:tetraacyldisaccharide 4'-kinase [bacterium]|nr:tetraacyldisaccharide 4'-kinase [bacterium]